MAEPRLTQRQLEIFHFIKNYIEEKCYPPALRDIAEDFSITVKAVHDHIKALQSKGIIDYTPRRSRSIKILCSMEIEQPEIEILELPILGVVAAGYPIFSEENYDGKLEISANMLSGGGEFFALRVEGESMRDAGILDGDYAVIEKAESASNGTIVVARINEEGVTLKRFFRESNRFRLQPENPNFQPLYTSDIQILGRLKMVIRSY